MDLTSYARNRLCLWMCSTMEWYGGIIFILALLLGSQGAGRFGKKLSSFLLLLCRPIWCQPEHYHYQHVCSLQPNWSGYCLVSAYAAYTDGYKSMCVLWDFVLNDVYYWQKHAFLAGVNESSSVVMAWFIDFLCKLLPENCQMTETETT